MSGAWFFDRPPRLTPLGTELPGVLPVAEVHMGDLPAGVAAVPTTRIAELVSRPAREKDALRQLGRAAGERKREHLRLLRAREKMLSERFR